MFNVFRIFNRTYRDSILNQITIITITFQILMVTGVLIYLTEIAGHAVQQAVLPTNKSSVLPVEVNPSPETISQQVL